MLKARFITVCFFMSSLITATSTYALVVGEVDMQKALVTTAEGLEARDKMKAEFEKLDGSLKKKQDELEKLHKELQNQGSLLKKETREAKEKDAYKKQMELVNEQQNSQQKLQQFEQTLQKPLVDKLTAVVEEVSKSEDVEMTFITGMGAPIYAKNKKDITDNVIKKYNEKHPVKLKSKL